MSSTPFHLTYAVPRPTYISLHTNSAQRWTVAAAAADSRSVGPWTRNSSVDRCVVASAAATQQRLSWIHDLFIVGLWIPETNIPAILGSP